MQKKIESFFQHSSALKPGPKTLEPDDLFDDLTALKSPEINIKYTRQALDSHLSIRGEEKNGGLIGEDKSEEERGDAKRLKVVEKEGKLLNKKRSYAQYHLDLGQSDFLLHTCKVCGIKYAKGDDVDEKVHATFHKNYTHGIPFKGWRHEKVIDMPLLEKDRVVLVSSGDSAAQRKKVEEVVKMMELELGDGWIFHGRCKVYLYVSSQRIAGCVVAEPIEAAHKVVSDSVEKVCDGSSRQTVVLKPTTLQFGQICFRREVSKKNPSRKCLEAVDPNLLVSVVCEEEATHASCGVRAIWVTPSNRRKHIATELLDAVRKSFSPNGVLQRSHLAFSQPTAAGKALAVSYTGTVSFLVYKC